MSHNGQIHFKNLAALKVWLGVEGVIYGCSNVAKLFEREIVFLRKKYIWLLQKFNFSQS